MRLFLLLVGALLLVGGCTSDPLPTVTPDSSPAAVSPSTPTPAATKTPNSVSQATRAPQPPPTAPGTTGIETPCDLGHGGAVRQRQIGFLKWSPDGSSLVFDVDLTSIEAIWEVGVDGSYARKLATPNPLLEPQSKYGFQADLSPDGRYVVYSTCGYEENADWRGDSTLFLPVYEIAIVGVGGGEVRRLTENIGPDQYPAWSPDGSRIAHVGTLDPSYLTYGPENAAIWISPVDGGEAWALDVPKPGAWAPVWSPDSQRLAVMGFGIHEPGLVHVVDVGENIASSTSRVVGATHILPSWSPDGTRLVFAEHRGGQEEPMTTVHIVDPENADSLVLPEIEGHVSQMAWHPDGSEILMMVYGAESVLRTITPDGGVLTDVFKDDDRQFGWVWSHGLAWSPGGSRFAIRTDYHWLEGHSRPFFGLATANRDGDDWRIVAVGDYGGLGFSLCDWPMPDPTQLLYGGLLDDDVKKHCEPIREHRS